MTALDGWLVATRVMGAPLQVLWVALPLGSVEA